MICRDFINDKSCPSYRNNALKGASAINNSPKKLTFNDKEVQLISKVLELSKYYVKDLQNQDLILKINKSLQILNKGALLRNSLFLIHLANLF
ncbi:MAG TPA: hypothetical protein VJ697_12490 [Nitrososphaeraceae archaeon]|nr:hypothetical protein [Nitrososphaeraceae archaeon]